MANLSKVNFIEFTMEVDGNSNARADSGRLRPRQLAAEEW